MTVLLGGNLIDVIPDAVEFTDDSSVLGNGSCLDCQPVDEVAEYLFTAERSVCDHDIEPLVFLLVQIDMNTVRAFSVQSILLVCHSIIEAAGVLGGAAPSQANLV